MRFWDQVQSSCFIVQHRTFTDAILIIRKLPLYATLFLFCPLMHRDDARKTATSQLNSDTCGTQCLLCKGGVIFVRVTSIRPIVPGLDLWLLKQCPFLFWMDQKVILKHSHSADAIDSQRNTDLSPMARNTTVCRLEPFDLTLTLRV